MVYYCHWVDQAMEMVCRIRSLLIRNIGVVSLELAREVVITTTLAIMAVRERRKVRAPKRDPAEGY